ncbi:unnamed protein product [Rotaria sp. Silwood1]|nr:unnamed protein product [Rotaria sp. Silwood1]CAF1654828.1 unnamed protein product [Rotaria sp. Silwood1]CAF3746059.1 unnamed protein product [Rotaria sp. Silwood1]CAF4555712.1 unnamed protein product [Rotaria sp. Silwood1]
MSVCQYYLRGNCRYGNRCRLQHTNAGESHTFNQHNASSSSYRFRSPRPSFNPNCNYRMQSSGHTNHNVENRYASQQQNSKYSQVLLWINENFSNKDKALDILGELQREAREWQKSIDLWRFTSKSLFPGGQPLEGKNKKNLIIFYCKNLGWQDQSFEEIKWAHRWMTNTNQEHIYKKQYYNYWENTERQLLGLSKLDVDTLKTLKPYIDQYIASNYKPSKIYVTDIEMKDNNDNKSSTILSQTQTITNYTPDDQLLEEERAAFESDTFEFGQIPTHAPPQQFC